MTSISLQDFERYSSKKAIQASFRRAKISEEGSYEEFVDQLYDDIDQLIYRMQGGPEVRQADSEDRLSSEVLGGLSIFGYDAVADGKTGGHVDLSVKMGEFSWIGEAKKDGNFHEGFLQLTTRYVPASGNFAHNQGGLIFYLIATPDAQKKLGTWRDDLTSKGHACVDCKRNQLAFYSDHKLESSGTNFKVRTMGVALYHKPKDSERLAIPRDVAPLRRRRCRRRALRRPASASGGAATRRCDCWGGWEAAQERRAGRPMDRVH